MFTNNISQIRKAKGLSQTDLAEAIGTTLNNMGKLERGDRRLHQDWIEKIANALSVEPHVLITPHHGSANNVGAIKQDRAELEHGSRDDPEELEIQQWDIAYGMGAGGYVDIPVTGETYRFSESWIRQFTRAPASKLFFATGTGDSMSPTILDSDIVLIDTSEHEVRMADRIWAAAYGQAGIIKRLRPMPNGSVKILSDNQNVAPETAYDGELHVVGRVVAIVRKM
ncbi:XRE family transcriptional regulator [Sphingobium yanoikuyae]|nr:XRE family transcriptional regulator [Sphingobium yanoikuyae]